MGTAIVVYFQRNKLSSLVVRMYMYKQKVMHMSIVDGLLYIDLKVTPTDLITKHVIFFFIGL